MVAGAPEFSMPAYVAYPLDRQGDHVSSAIEIMHRIADAQTRQAADAPAVETRRAQAALIEVFRIGFADRCYRHSSLVKAACAGSDQRSMAPSRDAR